MNATSRDFVADCDREMLMRALVRSGLTHEELAVDSSAHLRRIARSERRKSKERGDRVPTSNSRQLIGQLCSGAAKSTNELRAIAIERALGVDDGAIFVPRVFRVARNSKRLSA